MKSSLFDSGAAADRFQPFAYSDVDGETAPEAGDPTPLPSLTEAEALARELAARRAERAALEQHFDHELERRVEAERSVVARALDDFDRRREAYFHQLEREVVNLALALARKILHREAHTDPLLLAGAVRVALDQLAHPGEATLFVPPSSHAAWSAQLAAAGLAGVVADAGLEPDGCRLETPAGAADLGLAPQLMAIERGFADLLQRRDLAVATPSPSPDA